MKAATFVGVHQGRKVYRVPVRISLSQYRDEPWLFVTEPRVEEHLIIAHSAAEAANWAIANLASEPETEVVAFGPKGGETRRFFGWQSYIWRNIGLEHRREYQPKLWLDCLMDGTRVA